MDHRVERLGVAHAVAEARLLQQVRRARHRLHAARHAPRRGRPRAPPGRRCPAERSPEAQTLLTVSEETSFGMPPLICAWRLGIWPWPGLEHLAEDHVLHLVGRHLGALERGRDRVAAEVGGVERRERAAHLPERRPRGAEDHGLWHVAERYRLGKPSGMRAAGAVGDAVRSASCCRRARPRRGSTPTCQFSLTRLDATTTNVLAVDTNAVYWGGTYAALPGTRIRIEGQYPHSRYISWNVYDAAARPIDALSDVQLAPDPGSTNPSCPARRARAEPRDYTAFIEVGPRPRAARAEHALHGRLARRHLPLPRLRAGSRARREGRRAAAEGHARARRWRRRGARRGCVPRAPGALRHSRSTT